eukprot:Pgem_evm1s18393
MESENENLIVKYKDEPLRIGYKMERLLNEIDPDTNTYTKQTKTMLTKDLISF